MCVHSMRWLLQQDCNFDPCLTLWMELNSVPAGQRYIKTVHALWIHIIILRVALMAVGGTQNASLVLQSTCVDSLLHQV